MSITSPSIQIHQSSSHYQPDQVFRTLITNPRRKRKLYSQMDRFDVINFNDLTGPGGGDWVKIGGGSFGVVFSVSMLCF